MQTPESRRSIQGIALVLVLGFLVILSALVIAFFSSVTTVSTSARSYASGVSANLLADTAVQMVMAQIRQATTPPTLTSQTAWTSQPGLIRVFGEAGGPGGDVTAASTPYAYYKLFSSDNMVVSAGQIAGYQPATEYVGFTDPTQAPLFTDINSPILAPDSAGSIVVNATNYRADYPVLDPSAVNYVEGLSITTPPGYGSALPPLPGYNPGNGGNPAPMPVKWLYMLRDGTIVAPSSANKGVASFSGSGSQLMTKDNPIVGRIAFWTDDETCKVNLNTASEATFWDTPMVSSTPESTLGVSQPTKDEFQRYPGHPSTVCLSPILGKAFGLTIPNPATSYLPNPIPAIFKKSIYGFAPRVQEGGSTEASISVSTTTKPVTLDFDRLYGSVDEYLFKAPPPTASTRSINDARITNTTLERAKFFLTAYSRAPELNLYGQPRISIWPINVSTAQRTIYDNVFAFCSTVGNQTGGNSYPYYFTRQNPQSSTSDFAGIPRNVALYSYLQNLTAHPVPGFTSAGHSFLQKYSTAGVAPSPDGPPAPERDQILTEIFDYIRCVNLADTSSGTKPYTPLDPTNYPDIDWSGQVVPIQIGATRGFGRFPTISEAVILFAPAPKQQGDAANTARMQATLLIESFCPSYGYTGLKDTYSVGVDFSKGAPLKITDLISGQPRSLNFPPISYNLIDVDPWHGTYGRIMGGYEGFSHTLWFNPTPGAPLQTAPPTVPLGTKQLNSSLNTAPGSLTTKVYPFVSDTILYNTGSGQAATFSFLGGQFDILVYAGLNPGAQASSAVQKLTISFPAGIFKVPFPTGSVPFGTRIATHTYGAIADGFLLTTDSTRSVEATTDLRLIAAHKTVPAGGFSYFGQCSPNRWTATTPQANIHSLRCSNGARYLTAVPTGILAHDIPRYRYDAGNAHGTGVSDPRMADLPEAINGVKRSDGQYGDWDSGFAKFTDGAFINRADEGNVATAQNVSYYQGSDYGAVGGNYFSPNRIICSPGWFGSLPTGVLRNLPYQTLLFRPDSTGRTNHPGLGLNGYPADHLFLDLFDMPVVEPYPMSEPFSTAGKINLNYQIMPFGKYLKRDTAMRSLLRSEKLLCVDFNALAGAHSETFSDDSTDYRHEIDETTTLAFLERKWNPTFTPAPQDQVFRSASQICEVDLYPRTNSSGGPLIPVFSASQAAQLNTGAIDARWKAFWEEYRLTGDNDRERPYARLYSRVTTKSNTFTVHLRVQTLLKRTADQNQASWDEGKDLVTGEYRGSALIERYLDPADPRFTGTSASPGSTPAAPAINPDSQSLEQAYKFRVVATKQFGP